MNLILLIVSVLFYSMTGITGLIFIGTSILITYFGALFVKNRKLVLAAVIVLNAGALFFTKALPYTEISLAVPLGISYYSMQAISYIVDVYKGKYPPEKSLYRFALYILYLPHLYIGPIERYNKMAETLYVKRKFTWDNISNGALRLLFGMFKKFVIAGRAGIIISTISGDEKYTGAYALLAMLTYSIQLYCDFSGGIDMVLGVSKILGIKMSENFDKPYFSQTVKEFWNRWHITLGLFLRDYIYIPLGGNRKGRVRKHVNVIITFLVSGIWHGIHYVLWGLFNGIFVCIGDKLKTKYKFLNSLGVFLVISFLWSFFIWQDTLTALSMFGSVFTTFNYADLFNNALSLGLSLADLIVLSVSTVTLFLCDFKKQEIKNKVAVLSADKKVAIALSLLLIVAMLGVYGIGFNASAFIYSNF